MLVLSCSKRSYDLVSPQLVRDELLPGCNTEIWVRRTSSRSPSREADLGSGKESTVLAVDIGEIGTNSVEVLAVFLLVFPGLRDDVVSLVVGILVDPVQEG